MPRRLLELRAHLRLQLVAPRTERGQEPVHARRRRAQLVRCDRDEVQLHLVEPDHLLVHARLLDRERRALGDELQQLDVAVAEVVQVQRSDVQHTDDDVPHDERDAEHRLDPLLAQDGVENVGVVDVGKDHRPPLGGDRPGESAADRDAHALLDLLLEPDRRARDELVPLRVEQEHGARVHSEDVPCAEQERLQQLLQLEMRERDVGDRLHRLEPRPRLLLRLEQPGVVDREGRAVGDEL